MKQASKKEDTKQRILDEALRLFSQSGFDSVSVERIASAVGIKAPSLYKHFKSKRDIFDSIIERVNKMDSEKARVYEMPNGTKDEIVEDYKNISIEKIKKYPDDTTIYPWHGEPTTLGYEKENNKYLCQINKI